MDVIINAVVGSILPFQICKPITQPDLSCRRDDKVYDLSTLSSQTQWSLLSQIVSFFSQITPSSRHIIVILIYFLKDNFTPQF